MVVISIEFVSFVDKSQGFGGCTGSSRVRWGDGR
jgi:hypothetical protein